MPYELLFTTANALAAVCWLPLVVAPRSAFTARYTATPVAPLAFAVVYVVLVGVMLANPGEGGMGSLAELRQGFARDPVLLLAWVHYLAFDLMVGIWTLRDSVRLDLPRWAVAPCLVATFLLGPLGFTLYLGLRLALRGTLHFDPPQGGGA